MKTSETRRLRRGMLLSLLLGGALALLVLGVAAGVVQLLVVALLLAYVLGPLVRALEAYGLGRTAATTVVFAGGLVLVGGLVVWLVPAIVGQVQAIQALDVPAIEAAVEAFLRERLGWLGLRDVRLSERVQQYVAEHAADVLGFVPGLLAALTSLLVVPFLLFFLLKDGKRLKRGFINAVPNRYFEFALSVLHKVDVQLGNYLRGLIVGSTIVALLSIGALWVLGVEYYVLIGLFAGLANLVPYVGPVAGAALAVLVSAVTTGSLGKAVSIVVAFSLIQVVDNAVFQPLVLAKNVQLHPISILVVLFIGGQVFGLLGLLLAVPVAAVVKVFALETVAALRRYHLAD